MVDVLAAVLLTGLFCLFCGLLIGLAPTNARAKLATLAVIWFTVVAALAASGTFASIPAGAPALGLAVTLPVVIGVLGATRWSVLRALALEMPLPVLVAIHAGRILGVFFLLLLAADRLPPTFALIAGWGDIAVAVAALPLAWAIRQDVTGWRPVTYLWNSLGLADLITAVTLGVGSAPDSPVRFIFETPGSGIVASLPWALIPGALVPLYILTHLAIYAQLARTVVGHKTSPTPEWSA